MKNKPFKVQEWKTKLMYSLETKTIFWPRLYDDMDYKKQYFLYYMVWTSKPTLASESLSIIIEYFMIYYYFHNPKSSFFSYIVNFLFYINYIILVKLLFSFLNYTWVSFFVPEFWKSSFLHMKKFIQSSGTKNKTRV